MSIHPLSQTTIMIKVFKLRFIFIFHRITNMCETMSELCVKVAQNPLKTAYNVLITQGTVCYNTQGGRVSSLDFVEPLRRAEKTVAPYMLDYFKEKILPTRHQYHQEDYTSDLLNVLKHLDYGTFCCAFINNNAQYHEESLKVRDSILQKYPADCKNRLMNRDILTFMKDIMLLCRSGLGRSFSSDTVVEGIRQESRNGGENIYRWLDLYRNVTNEKGWFLKGIEETRRDCHARYEATAEKEKRKLCRETIAASRAYRAEHGTPIGNMERIARELIEASQNK